MGMTNGITVRCRFCGQPSAGGTPVCLDCSFRMHRAQKRVEAEGQDYRQEHADELIEQRRRWRQKREQRAERERERAQAQEQQGE